MIDIHTHILPGLDDGASCWEDTLNMARAAHSEGITTIISTPHHANGSYSNIAAEVVEHTLCINERLLAEGVPVTLKSGQEIRVHDDLLEAWYRGELLSLADSRYILLEMPSSRIPKMMKELIHELRMMNLTPIIAHPERNMEIVKHPDRLADLVSDGALAQVTSHSLLGGFGRRIEQAAWSLCRKGLIHIVSSDAHHLERRGFRLQEAYSVIRERMGEDWVTFYMNNAQSVIEDRPFDDKPSTMSSSNGALRRLLTYFR